MFGERASFKLFRSVNANALHSRDFLLEKMHRYCHSGEATSAYFDLWEVERPVRIPGKIYS